MDVSFVFYVINMTSLGCHSCHKSDTIMIYQGCVGANRAVSSK